MASMPSSLDWRSGKHGGRADIKGTGRVTPAPWLPPSGDCHALNIQTAVRLQDADHNAVCSGFPEHFDIAADDFKFLIGV